jgi:hypothetical protein
MAPLAWAFSPSLSPISGVNQAERLAASPAPCWPKCDERPHCWRMQPRGPYQECNAGYPPRKPSCIDKFFGPFITPQSSGAKPRRGLASAVACRRRVLFGRSGFAITPPGLSLMVAELCVTRAASRAPGARLLRTLQNYAEREDPDDEQARTRSEAQNRPLMPAVIVVPPKSMNCI